MEEAEGTALLCNFLAQGWKDRKPVAGGCPGPGGGWKGLAGSRG